MARTQDKAQTTDVRLPDLAREALNRNKGGVAAAVADLVTSLQRDATMLRAVIQGAVNDAVTYRVQHEIRDRRSTIIAQHARQEQRGTVVALAAGITASLLDMPLAGGMKLRDADRDAVLDQSRRYEAISSDTGRKARWLALIGQSVPAGRTVGDVVTEERAADLWKIVAAPRQRPKPEAKTRRGFVRSMRSRSPPARRQSLLKVIPTPCRSRREGGRADPSPDLPLIPAG